MNPIETAISPQREGAIDAAVAAMAAFIEREMAKLEAVGGFLDALYRSPNGSDSRATYTTLRNQRAFIADITEASAAHPRVRFDDPVVRVRSAVKIQRMLDSAAEGASASFDAYVAKLTAKIGSDVVGAEIVGRVWQLSLLTVTRADGDVEVWKTQMIINFSALGKLFNQWPTRQIKNRKAA